MAGKILLLNEFIDSLSSSSDEEIITILMKRETDQIPKVKNTLKIINEYSDREIYYIV